MLWSLEWILVLTLLVVDSTSLHLWILKVLMKLLARNVGNAVRCVLTLEKATMLELLHRCLCTAMLGSRYSEVKIQQIGLPCAMHSCTLHCMLVCMYDTPNSITSIAKAYVTVCILTCITDLLLSKIIEKVETDTDDSKPTVLCLRPNRH